MRKLERTAMLREAQTQTGLSWGLEIAVFLAVFGVGQLLTSIPVSIAQIAWMLPQIGNGNLPSDPSAILFQLPDWFLLISLLSTAVATVCTVLFCRLVQKRRLPSLGFRRRRAFREYLVGALTGALLFALAIALCLVTGSVKLSVTAFSLPLWFLFLLGFLIQGMSEEVLCRGFFLPSLARRSSLTLAVLVNSVMFSLLHVFNPGITFLALVNITLFGLLASLYVLRRGDLWGACAMHSLWNFVQGNVFGVNVSGNASGPSPLSAELLPAHSLWNGGGFGLEGGLSVTVVLSIGILILWFLVPNAPDERDLPTPRIPGIAPNELYFSGN